VNSPLEYAQDEKENLKAPLYFTSHVFHTKEATNNHENEIPQILLNFAKRK